MLKIKNYLVFGSLTLILLCSFYACSQDLDLKKNKSIEEQILKKEKVRFVIIGSSTAEGAKASSIDSSWVGRLNSHLKDLNENNELHNLAKSGYTTYHLISENIKRAKRPKSDTLRNVDYALSFNPTHIIINLPSNDAAYNYTVDEQLINFESMIQTCRKKNVKVFLCSAQPRNFKEPEKISNQLKLNLFLENKYSDIYIDFWTNIAHLDGTILKELNSGDGIHLNDKGHKILFDQVISKLGDLN